MCKNVKILFILFIPVWAIIGAYVLVNYHPETICLWKIIFHTDCWGCGITRAFYAFCKFDFVSAWNYNPRIFIVVPLLLFVWVKELSKELKKSKINH